MRIINTFKDLVVFILSVSRLSSRCRFFLLGWLGDGCNQLGRPRKRFKICKRMSFINPVAKILAMGLANLVRKSEQSHFPRMLGKLLGETASAGLTGLISVA